MKRLAPLLFVLFLTLANPALTFAQDIPTFPGQIAFIGRDYNVYTLAGDGAPLALTDDAGRQASILQLYQWPTWSTDGRLAYFRLLLERSGTIQRTDVFISPDGQNAGSEAYRGEGEVFNYAYWSPQDCDAGDNCRDLAVLLSRPSADGLVVELVRDVDGSASSRTAGEGAPFYYSWSPDGNRMFWHRNNERLDVYDITRGEIEETLDIVTGIFAAPAWSPVDDRLLFVAASDEGETAELVLRANGEMQTLANDLEGPTSFAWSPDGNRIAYVASQGVLFVIDAVSGETVARSLTTGVLAYFWSPNSAQIAYVTLAAAPGTFTADASSGARQAAMVQGEMGLLWSVLSVETGETRSFSTFLPTQDMLYLLTYFDQFAQSHRIWSPDSRHLIYGELAAENQPVITLLDTTSEATIPLTIAEGVIAVWSFD